MAEIIHTGVIKVVSNINKIEIPSIPSWKLMAPFIQFFSSINWKSDVEVSKENQRKIEREKFTRDVKIATYEEFFSIFFCVPCVNKIKSAPTSGININTERIGKFI